MKQIPTLEMIEAAASEMQASFEQETGGAPLGDVIEKAMQGAIPDSSARVFAVYALLQRTERFTNLAQCAFLAHLVPVLMAQCFCWGLDVGQSMAEQNQLNQMLRAGIEEDPEC